MPSSSSSLISHPVVIGLTIRLIVAWVLPAWLDDTPVPYTDVDYHVFTDAAAYVRDAGSPYQRTTYRYTPFLAELLALLPPGGDAGRYLFCVADVLCGWILWHARQQQRRRRESNAATMSRNTTLQSEQQHSWICAETQDALWWLYNPLAINICTRGSAESFMVLLPVLGTVWCVQQQSNNNWLVRVLGTGLIHGVAMHAKVYPVIYSLTLATALQRRPGMATTTTATSSFARWIGGFFAPAPLAFGLTALTTAAALTAWAVRRHGPVALYEGVLYHVSRVDHRHNYGPHWYGIYLARDETAAAVTTTAGGEDGFYSNLLPWMGRLLLLPQALWLVLTSWKLQGDLHFCLFLQTLVFVAQNKVITAQYFTWYLCLLPFCNVSSRLVSSPRLVRAVAGLVVSVGLWLGCAYLLEMRGWGVHRLVWAASTVFYAAHVNLVCAFLETNASMVQQTTHERRQTESSGDNNDKKKV